MDSIFIHNIISRIINKLEVINEVTIDDICNLFKEDVYNEFFFENNSIETWDNLRYITTSILEHMMDNCYIYTYSSLDVGATDYEISINKCHVDFDVLMSNDGKCYSLKFVLK